MAELSLSPSIMGLPFIEMGGPSWSPSQPWRESDSLGEVGTGTSLRCDSSLQQMACAEDSIGTRQRHKRQALTSWGCPSIVGWGTDFNEIAAQGNITASTDALQDEGRT